MSLPAGFQISAARVESSMNFLTSENKNKTHYVLQGLN